MILPLLKSDALPSADLVGQLALVDTSGVKAPKITDGSTWKNIPIVVTSGVLKMAAGEVTLDGSNPTSVTTGLATVVSAVATIKSATVLGDDPNSLTIDYGGSVAAGQIDLYAGKNSSGTDPTQVASTNNSIVISWIAFGT